MSTTTNTGLNQPAYNSTSPTWDQPLNFNETILDAVLGNTTSVAMPTGASATTTLTGPTSTGSLGQTQAMRITLTGSLSANQILQFPSGVAGKWIIYNTTSGSFSVTVSSAGGGTAVSVPQGYNVSIYSDGTNIRYTDDGLTNNFATLTVLGNTYLATTSGNVGIGTTSPNAKLEVYGQRVRINADADPGVELANTTTVKGYMFYDTTNDLVTVRHASAGTGIALNSFGNLLVGTTSSVNGGSAISAASGTVCSMITAATANANMIVFRNGNGNVGSISTGGTATSFNTSSDYRLKHDVEPMTTGLATVSALKPVTYKWNADNSDGEGFIAHELQAVIPHAVTGEKDAVNEDGTIKSQGVDYSKIVVHLVAACQEQQKLIVDLQERLAKAGL